MENGITPDTLWISLAGFVTFGSVIVLLLTVRHLLKKVGPNEALIVFGGRGTRIIVGGAAFVNPITEQCRRFSLELLSFAVAPAHPLYTVQGIAVEVEAVAQLTVQADDLAGIRRAAEQFLSKTAQEREQFVQQIMEGHLRHIVGHLLVEDLVKNTDYVAQQLMSSARAELERLGLVIVSFTLKQVRDQQDYIRNLGTMEIEDLRTRMAIAAVAAQRDIDVAEVKAFREAGAAKAEAEEDRVSSVLSHRRERADMHLPPVTERSRREEKPGDQPQGYLQEIEPQFPHHRTPTRVKAEHPSARHPVVAAAVVADAALLFTEDERL